MNNIDAVIVVAGWEDRFLEGLRRDLDSWKPQRLILLVFEEYTDATQSSREALEELCSSSAISVVEARLRRAPQDTWRTIQTTYSGAGLLGAKVLIDISTMPREVMWWSLKYLQDKNCKVEFIYHRPKEYASDWLTRDTDEPRLVYQCSGIAKLGLPTGLLLLSGFDSDRARRIMQYFEPSVVLLGVQAGTQFDNHQKNIKPTQKISEDNPTVREFPVDAVDGDCGLRAILEAVRPYIKTHNIITASLGPKVSGISLFQLHCLFPEIALSYAPSREFNPQYSSGTGMSVSGVVSFPAISPESLSFETLKPASMDTA